MKKKKTDWRETISGYQVHMKEGKEKFLNDVAAAYTAMFPNRADFFKRSLQNLRGITTSGYKAGPAGNMFCSLRVPTELWLFIKRWIPEFGDDSADVELLTKVWCDLVRPSKALRRTRLVVPRSYETRHVPKPRPSVSP